MMRMYARAIVGQRARGNKPQKRGRNISMLGALSFETVIASHNVYGAVDAVTFEAFIANKLVPNLWSGACVVMDNAKIHLGEKIRKLIEEAGAKLIYLSPYSPQRACPHVFNPIENFWSKVKASLRKVKPRNYLDLINAITESMLKVTKKDIRNWYAHCCYCTSPL